MVPSHRKVRSGRDEFRETLTVEADGNPEPSRRYTAGRCRDYLSATVALNDRLERPAPPILRRLGGEEIVRYLRKRRDTVNPLVLGSSPSGPTTSALPTGRAAATRVRSRSRGFMKDRIPADGPFNECRQPFGAPVRALARTIGCVMLLPLASIAPASINAESADATPGGGVRVVLPSSVTPDHYRIDIRPDAAALTFKGSVDVDVTVHRATSEIVLNSADLVIDRASVLGRGAVQAIRYDKEIETASLVLNRALDPGAYTLRLA